VKFPFGFRFPLDQQLSEYGEVCMSVLEMEHLSKKSFIQLIFFILDKISLKEVYFSQKEPIVKGALHLNVFSLEVALSGEKHIIYADGGRVREAHLKPGEVLCSPALHWKKPVWDSPHEMSSLLFASDHVKITYIDNTSGDSYFRTHPAKVFYYTSTPLDPVGELLLHTLALMADGGCRAGAADVLNALFKHILEILKRDDQLSLGKSERTWLRINQYLQNNFSSPINRAHVASIFKLHPSHVSRIFKLNGEETFSAKLTRLRLEHAALLLRRTNITIDEVTDACGYSSTTYFIAAFRMRYGVSPGKYRTIRGDYGEQTPERA
jgi:AraC-like DNA-binding protein